MKFLASLILILPLSASAQESAQFLKIGVGARAIGMGGAYTAMADDISALNWNPAGLSRFSKRELGAMHAELSDQTRYDFLGYAQPLQKGTLGVGAARLSQGSIQGRDSNGRLTGGFSAADTAITLAYGGKVNERLGLGGGIKFVRSDISNASAQTFAVDLGGAYELGARGPGKPSFGVAIQNLGPGMKFLNQSSPLPLTIAVGSAYRLPVGLTLAMDIKRRPFAKSTEISAGTEYAIFSGLALRTGYASNHGPVSGFSRTSDASGFAAGFGVKAFGYSLDYSMTPFGGLGNAQRVSLGARF